jgi:MGT family glycosyltransferase
MSHFGIVSPPVPGHLNPFFALGRALCARGHRITVFNIPDIEERVRAEGFDFGVIGVTEQPPGYLPETLRRLSQLKGMAALRFFVSAITRSSDLFCREAPAVIRTSGVDCLLVDQTEPAGAATADYLGLPFVNICNALAMNRDALVPPPFTAWEYRTGTWAIARNRIGYWVWDAITAPVSRVVNRYRERWGLAPYRHAEDSFSRLAQISQQPPQFDYPRRHLPGTFHYVGPLRFPSPRPVTFPWDQLDGRPLIYASLGTLQNRTASLFRSIAQACEGLPVQLLVAHGGGLSESEASQLPGSPLTVDWAPQLEVLSKASLTITHAGLNTVLDSLTQAVPIVAIPLTAEQPAIAARVAWVGAGCVVPFASVSVPALRKAVDKMLHSHSARDQARSLAASIRQAGGIDRAVQIIEDTITAYY